MNAPGVFQVLLGEVHCMVTALKVFEYPECKALVDWLQHHRKAQWRDLHKIIDSFKLSLLGLMDFINEVSVYSVRAVKQMNSNQHYDELVKRLPRLTKHGGLLGCIKITLKQIQPLRDQIALPTRALNIFLTSLTMVSMSYNDHLPEPRGLWSAKAFASLEGNQKFVLQGWKVIGEFIAFKHADFPQSSLAKPGIKSDICTAAEQIIRGKTCCQGCPTGCSCKPQVGLCPPTNDPFRGRPFIAVSRDDDGKLATVRRRSRTRSASRLGMRS